MPRGGITGTKHYDATSKYYGVSLRTKHQGCVASISHSVGRPWLAAITLKSGKKWCQSYATEREAAIAYDRYVLDHGLDRPLNILKPKVAA